MQICCRVGPCRGRSQRELFSALHHWTLAVLVASMRRRCVQGFGARIPYDLYKWLRLRTRCAGCEHAVEALADVRGQPLDVFCKCGGTFCFNCKEEAHRPVRTAAVLHLLGSRLQCVFAVI